MGNLKNVQWLTVAELAEFWAPLLELPVALIKRELRIALYKLEIEYPFADNINFRPVEENLPSEETLINREFVERFADKAYWKFPKFWSDERLPEGPGFPGRPSVMTAIVQELERIAERGELVDTLAAQSRHLERWAEQTHRGQQTPKTRAIENGIRTIYNGLRKHH